MNPLKFLFSILCLSMLSGCVDNYYKEYYVEHISATASGTKIKPSDIQLRFSTATASDVENEVWDVVEEGYECLGESRFVSVHCPWSCAVDHAMDIGATLILFRERFHKTKEIQSVAYVPSTSYSYTSGNVSAYSWNGGSAYGTYSSNTQTTSYQPIAYSKSLDLYEQQALFFRKKHLSNDFYGVILKYPQFLPGDSMDDEVSVEVCAVLKNSIAAKNGIRRGDVVDSINGKKVRVRKDIQLLASGKERIESLEVKKGLKCEK